VRSEYSINLLIIFYFKENVLRRKKLFNRSKFLKIKRLLGQGHISGSFSVQHQGLSLSFSFRSVRQFSSKLRQFLQRSNEKEKKSEHSSTSRANESKISFVCLTRKPVKEEGRKRRCAV